MSRCRVHECSTHTQFQMVQMVKRGTAFIFLVKIDSYNVELLQFFTFSPCVIVAYLSGQTEQGT